MYKGKVTGSSVKVFAGLLCLWGAAGVGERCRQAIAIKAVMAWFLGRGQ